MARRNIKRSIAWPRSLLQAAVPVFLLAGVASWLLIHRHQTRRATTQPTASRASGAAVSVVGYTDYECPFCAQVHEKTRGLNARSDVTFVRRHFPLDAACNPAVRRRIHPSACNLARAAICAEAQGRLEGMEDALFANQRERLPVETLATRVGLDLGRFRACLDSPETERRLAADVAAATRDGVRSTPSYVVDGAVYSGRFPAERLPPVVPTNGGWSRPRATDPDDRSTR